MKILIQSLLFIFMAQYCYSQGGIWTWMKGDTSGSFSYGIQGVASPSNNPPSKYQGAHSTDRLNNLWLFGGSSYADLWKYSISTNMWTWMKGDSTNGFGSPIYGTQGIASPLNNPGSTFTEGMLICDTFNNLWLLTGTDNILWKYDMLTNNWIWMKGTPGNVSAVYGTMGVPNINNTPTTIVENKTSWIDKNNDLWFLDNRNLMWRYTQNNNMWTWMKGDTNIITGVYGTKGVSSPANQPPISFYCHTSWKDKNDNLYIYDHDSSCVWRYSTVLNEWAWVAGTQGTNGAARFVQKCVPSDDKTPGTNFEERGASSLLCGDVFWLFGGVAFFGGGGPMNSLWQFNPNTSQWTWVMGDSTGTPYSYGVQGVPSPTNYPKGGVGHCLWSDNNNNLWLFCSQGGFGGAADLWRFVPDYTCVNNAVSGSFFTFNPPSDTTICAGDTTVMMIPDSVSNLIVFPNSGFTVSADSSKIYFHPLTTTNYTVSGTKGDPCPYTGTINFTITILSNGTIIHNPIDTLLCENESVTLAINSNHSVIWSPNDFVTSNTDTTLLTFTPNSTTTYTLITTDNSAICPTLDTIEITLVVYKLPKANFIADPDITTLDAPTVNYINKSTDAIGYHWIFNNIEFSTDLNTSKTFIDTGNYCITLVACNALDCCDTVLNCNSVLDEIAILPNVFSPNGDGNNDIIRLISKNIFMTSFNIFDRWGKNVYTSYDIKKGWNGKFKGVDCELGTYYYIINYQTLSGRSKTLKGDILLLR